MHYGLLLILLLASTARAQTVPASGPTPASFVPPHYKILAGGRATGDLNGDGRPDVVLALGPLAEETSLANDNLPPRLLLVLWRTAAGYRLATQSRQAILCKECGGAFGNPFEGLEIAKGVLSIYHSGGSSWRWSLTDKFRYQRGDLYQIGETYSYTHTIANDCPHVAGHRPGDEYHDVNLLTGEYGSVKVSEECKLLENKHGRRPVRPLRKLTAYTPSP